MKREIVTRRWPLMAVPVRGQRTPVVEFCLGGPTGSNPVVTSAHAREVAAQIVEAADDSEMDAARHSPEDALIRAVERTRDA